MDETLYELKILIKILEEKIEKLTFPEKFGDIKSLDLKFTESYDKIKNVLEEKGALYRSEIKLIQDLIKKVTSLESKSKRAAGGISRGKPIIIKESVLKKYKATYDFYKTLGPPKSLE
jgi:hypothetical protein